MSGIYTLFLIICQDFGEWLYRGTLSLRWNGCLSREFRYNFRNALQLRYLLAGVEVGQVFFLWSEWSFGLELVVLETKMLWFNAFFAHYRFLSDFLHHQLQDSDYFPNLKTARMLEYLNLSLSAWLFHQDWRSIYPQIYH